MYVIFMADFLHEHAVRFEEAFHSGKTCALQTAQIMISKLNPDLALVQRRGLSPLDDVEDIAEYARSAGKDISPVPHPRRY
ncbi:MAG: hypothetical protein CVU57_30850 [Deltaproteobacteria bacterium HGW-Deltaproteobacteria-15]|jgi:phosphohistidine phosphatase SixA|nr:MAG: hypothetical protein CVU57_30850 [Deltaproteobacteria bacterium HGW-Deltaproteobacteria-15]